MKTAIKLVTAPDKLRFNSVVGHPLQSWEWGNFREKLGQQVVRFGVWEDHQLSQGFQVTFHQLPKLPFTVGYLPKSFLPTPSVLEFLKRLGQANRSIFIKLEPNAPPEKTEQLRHLVKGKPLFTRYTSIIDLTRPEEELLQNCKSKTRYNIKLAQKHGVTVQEDNSPTAFNQYLRLLLETTKRQGFYAHNEEFHRLQWEMLQPAGISHLLTAKHQGKVLAAHLFFVFNKTLYYPYGASTRESKAVMAPTLLMWEAIRFGQGLSCAQLDLWGDLEPHPSPRHPYYGFHKFKEGFSPKLVEFIGTFDLVINPALYPVYRLADNCRWFGLRWKAKIRV